MCKAHLLSSLPLQNYNASQSRNLSSYRVAACAEPFAVTLHAVARAGNLLGRRVLVTGSGPIGVLVVAAARLAGAAQIVVTDLFDEPLAIAERMGASSRGEC